VGSARHLFVSIGFLASVTLAVAGCPAAARPPHPIEQCAEACHKKAAAVCSEAECARGCELVLDRIVERESAHVVACVARSRRRCTDMAWAECAARVGPHADGGPPALPPPDPFDE
jgi:hypothetical protein